MLRIGSSPMILSGSIAVAAGRTAVIDSAGAFAYTSWAAWHDYTTASLTPKGAHMNKLCPIRLTAGTRVEVIEEERSRGIARQGSREGLVYR
jgi:hypothetical protein